MWYVAYIDHETCVSNLKQLLIYQKPIKICFCRPSDDWDSLQQKKVKVLREGILQKVSGVLRRRSPRYLSVQIDKLLIQKNKDQSKSYQVSEFILKTQDPSILQTRKPSFIIVLNKVECEFECSDLQSCIYWEHSIESAVKDVFSMTLPNIYKFNLQTKSVPKKKTPFPVHSNNQPEISKQHLNNKNVYNPYEMLKFSRVEITRPFKIYARESLVNDDQIKQLLMQEP